jgi:hypothetical protein
LTNVSGNLTEQDTSVFSQWIVEAPRDDQQILVSASISSIADLTRIADGTLRLRASLGDSVRSDVHAPRLADAIAGFRLDEVLARNDVAGPAQVVAR